MGTGVYLVVFVSVATLWVTFDAQAFDWSGNNFCDRGWKWVVGCLFLFIVAFPACLWQRRNAPRRVAGTRPAPAMAGGSDALMSGLPAMHGYTPRAAAAPAPVRHAASPPAPAAPVDLFSAVASAPTAAPLQQRPLLHSQAAEVSPGSYSTGGSVPVGLLAGAAVALLGGLVWAGVVIVTRFDFGFLAWSIGAATGFVVLRVAGQPLGGGVKLAAGLFAVGGIVVGKYVIFVHDIKALAGGFLAARGITIGYLDTGQMSIFIHHFGSLVSPLYGIWTLCALVAAVLAAGRTNHLSAKL